MLNNIIAFSIKNKLIVALCVLALILYGSYQLMHLPIDAVPDITDNQVQVITLTPSLGAPDVERLITFPIEQASSNIPGIKAIRSFSRFGLSLITIVFNDDVDVYWARQQVSERLKIAGEQIPKGIGTPRLAPVTTGLGEIYQYVLKAKKGYQGRYNTTELRSIQDWIVKRQLLNVKGVADVSSFGGRLKQYEIAVDPQKLQSYGISISDVFSALEKNNENTGGAYIEKGSTVLYIRAEGLIGNIADIENIAVKITSNGTPLLISQVAEVRIGHATRYGAITYNDEGEVAGAVVMMLKGDNSNRVIKEVKERIAQIQKTLPEGLEIEAFLDRSKMVNSAIATVSKNLLEGALIVILILVLFLGNLRAGAIVASVIPLSLLFAVIMMNIFGVSGNLMSLGALDFGLIVDGAVIIVEACVFQLHSSRHKQFSQLQMDDLVYHTSTRLRNAAVFGELIILVVYLPIFTLQGIEGKMFKPMAQTVAFALLGAFILSLTYVPMMAAFFLDKKGAIKRTFSDKMMEAVERFHHQYLLKALAIPKLIISAVLVLFVVSLLVLSSLGGEFIPELPEGDFAVETRVLPGSSIGTSSQAILKSAHLLMAKFPEIEKIVGKSGSGEIPTDPMPMEASDMMIILKDKSEWTSAKDWPELSAKMSAVLQDIPGVSYSFQYPVAMRFNELMTGAKQDVVCKIFGENLDTLSKYAKILGEVVKKVDGAEDIYVETMEGLPQIIVAYKRNEMAQFGLNIQDVNKVLNTALAGQSAGLVYEDEKRFDLVVRLAGEQKQNLEDIQNLLIPTAQGTQVPLQQVADINIVESVNQIHRDDAKRRITLGFNIGDRDVQSVVKDLQARVEQQVKLPSGYYVSYGGAFENLLAAKKRLSLALPLALFIIFMLLYFAFHSVKQALLIYSAIPLSAMGGILFLALRGMPFSISAGIGFIALFGVAVLNGIVLIAAYNSIRKEGESDPWQIVLQGTRQRLRPVLMTALVASLGFLPMALSRGAGAEVQRPLATVVIGGLLIATMLTLFVLPLLYVLFGKKFKIKGSVKAAVILMLVLSQQSTKAQNYISLQAAIDSALQNNLQLKNEALQSSYQQKLKAAAVDIPQSNVLAEYGQINSIFNDNKIGIAQSIAFPTVYSRQRNLQNEIYKSTMWTLAWKQAEIKKQLCQSFYLWIHLQQKKFILQRSDSIYANFVEKASLRLAKGESNLLEKASAETQHGAIKLQLQQLNTDIEVLEMQLQLILNTRKRYLPSVEKIKIEFTDKLDNTSLGKHPRLQILKNQKEISGLKTQIEKARMLPNLYFAYYSMSMKGTGADNKYYEGTNRFNSIQLGVGLPLFYSSQQAKILSSRTLELISENQYRQALQDLGTEYANAYKQYENKTLAVQYYQQSALANAKRIQESAQLQYSNGVLNYLEYSMLINQAISIQSSYAEALNELNQSIILLNYLAAN